MFSLWYGDNFQSGVIRYLTPVEAERLMGLPDGWTALGVDGEPISESARYRALGNAIVVPCAEYIMAGIAAVLGAESSKPEEPGAAPEAGRGTVDMNRP